MQVNGPLEPKKHHNEIPQDISDSELEEKTEKCFLSALPKGETLPKSLEGKVTETKSKERESSANFLASLFKKSSKGTILKETLGQNKSVSEDFTRASTPSFDLFKTAKLSTNYSTRLMEEFHPAKAPIRSTFLNKDAADLWISSHPTEFQDIAKKLIQNIKHVTHEKFLKELKNCIENFNRYLDTQQDKSYSIVIPGNHEKSALWVTSLAADFLKYPPSKIIMNSDPNYEQFISESNMKNVVLFDDASYSGIQMSGYLEKILEKSPNSTVHAIIPFISESAIDRIYDTLSESTNYKLYSSQVMESFSSFLTPEEKKLLETKGNPVFSPEKNNEYKLKGFDNLIPIYFDHKIGDNFSVPPSLNDGSFLDSYRRKIDAEGFIIPDQRKPILFIPKIHPPYKPPL
jgi:hypothetical protein